MPPRFHSYADTAALDDAALREAAAAGAAADRVLACWRLMTRGQAIRTIAAIGPDAGVRRLLLLGLASSREVDLLVVIAREDPDPGTRLEALRWVVRVAEQAALPALLGPCLVAERDAEVLSELLGPLTTREVGALRPAVDTLLQRGHTGLRRLVADHLLDLESGFSPAVEAALARETDPDLRDHWLRRWATSNDHARLLDRAITTGAHIDPSLRALASADRRYPFAVLAPLLAACSTPAVVQVLGPPYPDAARAWLRTHAQQWIDDGQDPEPLLAPLLLAHEDVDISTLPARDRTLLELLAGGHPRDHAELSRLFACAPDRLRRLAARALARLDGGLAPELRTFALTEMDWSLLERWAASQDHPALLDAATYLDDEGEPGLHFMVLAILAEAGRTYPWPALTRIAAAVEATAGWDDEPTALDNLLTLIARPWPPAARAWVLDGEHALELGPEGRRRYRDAVLATPEVERTPQEQAWLAENGD